MPASCLPDEEVGQEEMGTMGVGEVLDMDQSFFVVVVAVVAADVVVVVAAVVVAVAHAQASDFLSTSS